MNFFRFLFSKANAINITIAIVLFFALCYFGFSKLDSYTNHGEYIEVPDFTGFTIDDMEEAVHSKNLRYFLLDSIHDLKAEKGTILKQNPAPGEFVKENRTIYVTINALEGQKVKIPDLIHKSSKLAQAQLKVRGLKIGEISYVPDIAKNAVLKMLANGKTLKAGDEVEKGTKIDLVLGRGDSGERTYIPMLVGRTFQGAEEALKMEGLNLGIYRFNANVTDTASAVVIRQIPAYNAELEIPMGSSVDIILGDESDLPTDSIN
jgi:beta-lactam-binding protein with PASTA domain